MHGFPHQPTAVAFDPIQRLLAIGTKTGSLRMYPFLYYYFFFIITAAYLYGNFVGLGKLSYFYLVVNTNQFYYYLEKVAEWKKLSNEKWITFGIY